MLIMQVRNRKVMSTKKSWFTWGVWAIYSIMLCSFFAIYINAQCNVLQFGKYATILAVCLAGVSILGIYRLLCLVYEKWGHTLWKVSNRSKGLLEAFAVMSLFAGAILVRINHYVHYFTGCYGTTDFYVMATVKEGNSLPTVSHGASYLYTGMLSTLFSLFGNKQTVAIVMQIILQLAGILLFYFAVKNLAGRMEAVISMAVLVFFPAMVKYSFTLMPENLYFCLFSGMLFLIALYKKFEEKRERKTGVSVILLALIGIGIGYMSYLDVIGILLLVGACFVILAKKRKSGRNITYISVVSGASVVTLLAMFFAEAFFENATVFGAFFAWWNLYFTKFAWNYMIAGPDVTLVCNLLICAGAAWCIFSFLRKKEDKGCFYMLSLVVLSLMVSFGSQNMSYQLLITAFWSVLAALGITSVMFVKEKTVEAETAGNVLMVADVCEKETKTETVKTQMEEIHIENLENNDTENSEKKSVQFIENPLPLPKKHVKKVMDYKFEPEEHLMKYDIEVSDDDDFDLQ